MSPRTKARKSSLKSNSSNKGRQSRKHSIGQHSSSPDQRPLTAGPSKAPKASPAKAVKRPTRSTSSNQKPDSDEGDSDGNQEMGEDNDEGDNDTEEPEVIAPSGPVTRRRGHQTGLSQILSKTKIAAVQAGSKRELSVSTIDSETRTRPRKMSKVEQPPNIEMSKVESTKEEDEASLWDSDYGAVNDISESDDDIEDSDIERHEEQKIIESIEHEAGNMSRRAQSVDSWGGYSLDTLPVDDESQFFSEHFALTEPTSDQDSAGKLRVRRPTSDPPPVRRVRFADIESSRSSTSTSHNSEIPFPDLLEEPDTSALRTAFNLAESEEDQDQFSDGSYWDVEGATPSMASRAKTPMPAMRQRSCSDSSGYETDTSEGETTDEDPVPPQTVNRPHTNLRLDTDSPHPKRIFTRGSVPRANVPRGKGPCLGTWIADPAKPIGIVDRKTKKMFFIKPPVPTLPNPSNTLDGDTGGGSVSAYISLSNNPGQRNDGGSDDTSPESAFPPAAEGDSMMDGLLASAIDRHSQALDNLIGPSDASWALNDFDVDYQEVEEEEEDPEDQLDITNFIDFGDDSSDSNGEGENDLESEELTSPVTPLSVQRLPTIRPKQTKDRTSSQSLLNHFDKGIVSAFRRNQHRHQTVLRQPLLGGRAMAIKGGRHHAALDPISPLRKRRTNGGLDAMAPFTGLNGTRMRTGTL